MTFIWAGQKHKLVSGLFPAVILTRFPQFWTGSPQVRGAEGEDGAFGLRRCFEREGGCCQPCVAGLAAQQGSVTAVSSVPVSPQLPASSPRCSLQQWELFPFTAGVSMCTLLTASSGWISPQILWGFFGCFYQVWLQWPVQTAEPFPAVSGRGCRLSPAVDSLVCPVLATKDEYPFNSSTEEQNESNRLNVLREGGNGEQNEANITDVLFRVFFPSFSYLLRFVENLWFCPAHTGWAQCKCLLRAQGTKSLFHWQSFLTNWCFKSACMMAFCK